MIEKEEHRDEAELDDEDAVVPASEGEEHSDAPGPHGTGKIYPRGSRSEEEDET